MRKLFYCRNIKQTKRKSSKKPREKFKGFLWFWASWKEFGDILPSSKKKKLQRYLKCTFKLAET